MTWKLFLKKNIIKRLISKNTHQKIIQISNALNRQMERLKYCVQNVDYRLVIIFKSYLCFLHTEEDIDLFYIEAFPNKS